MTAIQHLRGAEENAQATLQALNRAILAAKQEGNELLAYVTVQERNATIVLRDRINGIRRAAEKASEPVTPTEEL